MTAVLMTPPYIQFFDSDGVTPLNGGKVYTYTSTGGTFTTAKATYTTAAGSVEAANPVTLNSRGIPTSGNGNLWLSGTYDFKVTDANDVQVGQQLAVTAFTALGTSSTAYFQSFSGTGAQTAFTTSTDLGTDEKAIFVWVDAGAGKGYEIQNPSAYTISGTTLTFSVAPASGTNNIYVSAPSSLVGAAATAAADASASAAASAASETLASQWATLTSGQVATTDYSAKAYAIGGTGVTTTSGKGAAKEWAITTGGAVDTSEYSAKEYATGTTVAAGSAKQWATKLVSAVNGSDFSAKYNANLAAAEAVTAAAQAAIATAAVASASGGMSATSTSSVAIGTGSKSFTTQSGKYFAVGQFVIASSTASPTNYMHGTVTSYSGTSLVINSLDTGGSGTIADWTISVSGTNASVGSGEVLLNTATASNSPTLSFNSTYITSAYSRYKFVFIGIKPANDGVNLYARVSENNGSNIKSGAADYTYVTVYYNTGGSAAGGNYDADDTKIILTGEAGVGNAATEHASGIFELFNPAGTALPKVFSGRLAAFGASTNLTANVIDGAYVGTTNAINYIQFLCSSGNITSGIIQLWGIV